jgi:hypothetical protein
VIVVRVQTDEPLPRGERAARVLAEATIANDGTGTPAVGHYDVVLSNPGGLRHGVLCTSRVLHFPRGPRGSWDLLFRALDAADLQPEPPEPGNRFVRIVLVPASRPHAPRVLAEGTLMRERGLLHLGPWWVRLSKNGGLDQGLWRRGTLPDVPPGEHGAWGLLLAALERTVGARNRPRA